MEGSLKAMNILNDLNRTVVFILGAYHWSSDQIFFLIEPLNQNADGTDLQGNKVLSQLVARSIASFKTESSATFQAWYTEQVICILMILD